VASVLRSHTDKSPIGDDDAPIDFDDAQEMHKLEAEEP
jgi:hypothetical protein